MRTITRFASVAVLSALAGGLMGVAKACYDIMPNNACSTSNGGVCSGVQAEGYMDGVQCGGYSVVSNYKDIPNSLNTHAAVGKTTYNLNPPLKDCWDTYYCYFVKNPDGHAYCSHGVWSSTTQEPDNSLGPTTCP